MKLSVFGRTPMAERLTNGLLSAQLNSLAKALKEQGYAPYTVQQYIRECDIFSSWLESIAANVQEIDDDLVKRYLTHATDLTASISTGRRRAQTRPAVTALVQHLRDRKEIGSATVVPASVSEGEEWLLRYREYLQKVLGLSCGTQDLYLRFVARFLDAHAREEKGNLSFVTADTIVQFVQRDTAARKGCGPQNTVSAIRSFLRFLVSEGVIAAGLESAIPGRKRYPQFPPQPLTKREITSLLAASNDGTAYGKRNYAILMLLSQLGLRAGEVLQLQLDDVDWINSCILIRAGKTHCERKLPLPSAVARALLKYLQSARPRSTSRQIFLECEAPFRPLQKSPAITHIVKTLLDKVGIQRHRSGAHLLRHTLATNMVNHGASFFDVADLLGHRSLRTTGIYAKLDLKRLSRVSLPWPGGAQ